MNITIPPFNWLDTLLLIIMAVLVIRGLWTGFSRAVATLMGAVTGFWAAINYYHIIAIRFAIFIDNELTRSLAAFFVIFIVVYLVFTIAGILIHGFFKIIKMGWFDRLLGGAIGFVKGAVISGGIIFILTLFLPDNAPLLRHSVLYPTFGEMARIMTGLVPANLKGKFMWKWRQLGVEIPNKAKETISHIAEPAKNHKQN
jgi:membrane protein required for colicin V production